MRRGIYHVVLAACQYLELYPCFKCSEHRPILFLKKACFRDEDERTRHFSPLMLVGVKLLTIFCYLKGNMTSSMIAFGKNILFGKL